MMNKYVNRKRLIGFSLSAIMLGLTVGAFFSVWDKWPSLDQWTGIFDGEHLVAVFAFFGCMGLATLLRGLRWKRLMSPFYDLTLNESVSIFGWSFFLTAFLPYRLGETVRPLWIKRMGGTGFGALGAQALERINDLAAILLTAALIVSFLPDLNVGVQATGKLFFVFGLIGYGAMLVLIKPVHRWLKALSEQHNSGVLTNIALLCEGISSISDKREFLVQAVLAALIWSVVALGYYIFLTSFFPELTWICGPAIMVVIALASLLPVTPGNIGLYEAAAVFLLIQLGTEKDEALVVSIALHSAELIMALFIGLAAKTSLYLYARKKAALALRSSF